jgi:hypothetical protein
VRIIEIIARTETEALALEIDPFCGYAHRGDCRAPGAIREPERSLTRLQRQRGEMTHRRRVLF